MWDDDDATPWDILVDCFDRMQTLEEDRLLILETLKNHQDVMQQLLLQNQKISQQNAVLVETVNKLKNE